MRLSTILLAVLVLAFRVGAQDPAIDHLKTLVEHMASAKSYHVVARVDMIGANGKVMSSETSEAYVAGMNMRTTIGQRTTVMTTTEFLFIDEGEKQMVYETRSTPLAPAQTADIQEQMRTLLAGSAGRIRVHTEDERNITLRIVGGEEDDYALTDLVVRRRDHTLERIIYQVKGASRDLGKGKVLDRIEVVYTTFELDVKVPAEQFNIRRYVRPGKDGLMIPAPGFEHLELTQNSGI